MVTTKRRTAETAVRRVPAGSARELAASVLVRVEGGAYANLLLHHELARRKLPPAEAALATELVLGTLRQQGRLDWTLAGVLRTPIEELPAQIRAILRTAAYQLLFLSRIPTYAAVDEAVRLARRRGHAGTAKLTNAVLRRLTSEGERALPDLASDPSGHIAVRHSHPLWLVDRWVKRWGLQDTRALCEANNLPAPWTARINVLRSPRDRVIAELAASGLVIRPTPLPEGVEVQGAFDERHRLVQDGVLTVQDLAAMLVTHALDPQPGEHVIDACAAPGGKTTHIAERMSNRGRIIACDLHDAKLRALSQRAETMGITIVNVQLRDAKTIGKEFSAQVDRLLVDAPCSGLGVVRRRPEIKWRIAPEQIQVFARLQLEILAGACTSVRPGGVLVYSVCTTEPEEGPEVIQTFLAAHPDFAPDPISWPRDLGLRGDPAALLLPHRHGTDGFFIARLRRTGTHRHES